MFYTNILDPCRGVDCGASGSCINGVCRCGLNAPCSGNSDTCVAGVCRCGTVDACGGFRGLSLPIDNICSGGVCRCGAGPQCDTFSIFSACLDVNANLPSGTDTAAFCQVRKLT